MDAQVTHSVERLTWSEACKRYPNEWVVVVDVEYTDETCHPFDTAVLVAHHERRADVSASVKVAYESHKGVGAFWTGRISIPRSIRVAMR